MNDFKKNLMCGLKFSEFKKKYAIAERMIKKIGIYSYIKIGKIKM